MSRFSQVVEKIGADRILHVLACLIITLVVTLICHKCGEGAWVAAAIGAVVSIVVGIGKELYDFFAGGYVDRGDLAADFAGAMAGMILGGFLG